MFVIKATRKSQAKRSSVKLTKPKFLYYYRNLSKVGSKRICCEEQRQLNSNTRQSEERIPDYMITCLQQRLLVILEVENKENEKHWTAKV